MPLLINQKNKVWIWLLSILLLLILIIAAGIYWKPFISKKIKNSVSQATQGLYQLDFADIHLNIFTGSVKIDSLSFKADTITYNRLKKSGTAPKYLFNIVLEELYLTNIHLTKIYFKKRLQMNSIVISKPSIKISFNNLITKTNTSKKKTLYQQISESLNSIRINTIILKDADVTYTNLSDSKPRVNEFKGLVAKVSDIKIDSAAQFDNTRFYYTKDIHFQLKNYHFITRDSLYNISLGEISSSTSSRFFKLRKLKVKPLYSEMEFSRKYKTQHDRYDLYFEEIMLQNIDFIGIITEQRLIASGLFINGGDLKIFMNRELPPVTFDKGRNYPHVALRRLKFNTRIDTLKIKNTDIRYSEYNPESQKKGTVSFNRFHATILNVTNDSISLSKNHWAEATTSAWLMNKGLLNVKVNFNLTSKMSAFNFSGTVGKMDMTILNPLSTSLGLVEIRSGIINKAEFQFFANRQSSEGHIKLYYNNLVVNILKKVDESNKLKKKDLVSTFANVLIIKNDNPGEDGKLRIAKTVAERQKSKSFFNLMWLSVFEGIKESVGATLEDVDKVQVRHDKQQQRKTERKKRREERKKEREDKKKSRNER